MIDVETPMPLMVLGTLNDTYTRTPTATITLSGLPPTVNHAYRKRGKGFGLYMTRDASAWKDGAVYEARACYRKRDPIDCRVAVLVVYRVRSRGGWDIDNRLKALLDALTGAGIWCDDRQIWHLTEQIEVTGKGEPETHVFVWEIGA